MNSNDIPKTAVCTPFGSFEFLMMPFGLKNSGASFQRLMHEILGDLPFIFCYIDDILVGSRNPEEHEQQLRRLFSVLWENHLVINPEKCTFGQPTVSFLGHSVSSAGIAPLPGHVTARRDFPPPSSPLQIQRFLGMINFYR